MYNVYEIFEYTGEKCLRLLNVTEDEATQYIKENSKKICSDGEGITYMSGSYCWYLQKELV